MDPIYKQSWVVSSIRMVLLQLEFKVFDGLSDQELFLLLQSFSCQKFTLVVQQVESLAFMLCVHLFFITVTGDEGIIDNLPCLEQSLLLFTLVLENDVLMGLLGYFDEVRATCLGPGNRVRSELRILIAQAPKPICLYQVHHNMIIRHAWQITSSILFKFFDA